MTFKRTGILQKCSRKSAKIQYIVLNNKIYVENQKKRLRNRHTLDTYARYNRFQKVKTFYSHPIIRWVVQATRQEEPSRALLVF